MPEPGHNGLPARTRVTKEITMPNHLAGQTVDMPLKGTWAGKNQ